MHKLLLGSLLFAFSTMSMGASSSPYYQVDMIVFTHGSEFPSQANNDLIANTFGAVTLKTEQENGAAAYSILPASRSDLKQESNALQRQANYRVLFHYSWLQPLNNQQAVVLPKTIRDGWALDGTIRITRSNYYTLNANLLLAPFGDNSKAFNLVQKQRLKGGTIYYLDNPQAGMLIKIHQLA